MNNSYSLIAASVTWAMMSGSLLAGELNTDTDNTLNVFVSGTTAVAADVNENFEKVADAVNDNSARIDANTAAITTNTTAITGLQTNKLNSADLGTALDTATTTSGYTVDGNAANILINATAISIHTTAISNNATNIANANADIDANTAAIIVNSADIATNAANITTNTTAIAGKLSTSALGTALDTTTTTAGNSIDGNTAAIADNATDIATNADAIQDLQQHVNRTGIACAGNDASDIMVRVGPLCVDAYEASVWNTSQGGGTQYGVGSDNYLCDDNGNDCSASAANPIYARSEVNLNPSAYITWFQALQACANAGKRLMTNAEWQMAAAGTLDANCTGGAGLTGDRPTCVSNWGAYDMAGNVDEWVADWLQGARTTIHYDIQAATTNGGALSATDIPVPTYVPGGGDMGIGYGSDPSSGVQQSTFFNQTAGTFAASNFPAAIYRGANGIFGFNAAFSPSSFDNSTGFRCAR